MSVQYCTWHQLCCREQQVQLLLSLLQELFRRDLAMQLQVIDQHLQHSTPQDGLPQGSKCAGHYLHTLLLGGCSCRQLPSSTTCALTAGNYLADMFI